MNSEKAALQAALNARMTGRRGCHTDRIKVKGLNAIYLHTEYEKGRPVKFRISSPGKYSDAHIGELLDAVCEQATEALRG